MRHRKIPKKNQRKKLKSVDPYNTEAYRAKEHNQALYNNAPTEEQVTSNTFKNFAKLCEDAKVMHKNRKNNKNKFAKNDKDLSAFKRRPWEDERQFLHRVNMETHAFLGEHQMKVKFGLLGEDPLESKSERRRRKKKEKDEQNSDKPQVATPVSLPAPSKNKNLELSEREKLLMTVGKTSLGPNKKNKRAKKKCMKPEETPESAADQFGNDKDRAKRSILWNEREMIGFSERADAPPQFSGALKTKMNALSAKAGRKRLLLDDLIDKNKASVEECDGNEFTDNTVPKHLREERDKVINEYRKVKRLNIMRKNVQR